MFKKAICDQITEETNKNCPWLDLQTTGYRLTSKYVQKKKTKNYRQDVMEIRGMMYKLLRMSIKRNCKKSKLIHDLKITIAKIMY